jgi:HNH endonuclease
LVVFTVKVTGGKEPPLISIPPTPDATYEIELSMASIESSTRGVQERLKRRCLKRDGFRCIYSGWWDKKSCKDQGIKVDLKKDRWGKTECAHIIPFALGKFDDEDATRTQNRATIWYALYRYFPALKGKIGPDTINQEQNALTLDHAVHGVFGDYGLTFMHRIPVSFIILFLYSSFNYRSDLNLYRETLTRYISSLVLPPPNLNQEVL